MDAGDLYIVNSVLSGLGNERSMSIVARRAYDRVVAVEAGLRALPPDLQLMSWNEARPFEERFRVERIESFISEDMLRARLAIEHFQPVSHSVSLRELEQALAERQRAAVGRQRLSAAYGEGRSADAAEPDQGEPGLIL